MFKYIKRLVISSNKRQTSMQRINTKHNYNKGFSEDELREMPISCSLSENIKNIKAVIGNNVDLVIRNIELGRSRIKPAVVIYFDNMIDASLIDRSIIQPLILDVYTSGLDAGSEIVKQLQAGNIITRGEIKTGQNLNDLLNGLLKGEVGLIIDEVNEAYIISDKGYQFRQVAESDVEPVVRGPREAFIEVLSVNIGLIRKRIHSPNLVFESLEIGTVGKIIVCMVYIKGLCQPELYNEVRCRLENINIDGVLESNYIEEFIQDNPYSIFPQMRNTERPDIVASSLLEGRVGIIVDNTPVALIAPGEFFSLMQSTEDYYTRFTFSSLVRPLRYFAFLVTMLLPSLYIAVTNYHQEMIPTSFLTSIMSSRAEVPFPTLVEAFSMIIIFEILHEAGIRLPRPMGQAVSIVGALVIGQAAVQASIVSPLMIIIVALTAITKYSLPQYNITLPVRILRLIFMLMASFLGLFGIMICMLFLMLHLSSLESFGKPYMSPLAPLRTGDLKDTAVRSPWWALVNRPAKSTLDEKRMKSGQVPQPAKKKGE